MTELEAEADQLFDRVLTWFNDAFKPGAVTRPDELCKDIMGWMSQAQVLRMKEEASEKV